MRLWPWHPNSVAQMTEEEVFKRYGQPLTIPIPQDLETALLSLAEASSSELMHLDRRVREVSPWRRPDLPPWPQIGADALERILKTPEPATHLLGLVSFHQSGYIRELAVRRLSQINTGKELPFLLLRLNDWVAPVYHLALAAVQERITPQYADALIRDIINVFDLEGRTRHQHEPVLSAITALLKRPDCDAALQQGMVAPEKQVRRLCFRILREADDARLPEAASRMLADSDPVIRLAAARCARVNLPDDALPTLLPLMKRDGSLPVRREALYICLERLPKLAPAELRAALLDTNAAMREIARYHLRQSSEFDVPAFYREALRTSATPSELATGISGLGEIGIAVDAGLILPYLSHPLAKVRRATVRAVSKLDGDNQFEALFAALTDERPSVTHEAREALRPRLGLLDDSALWWLFKTAEWLHVRRDVLALLASLPKWESIPFLVEAAANGDPLIQEYAIEEVRGWSSRYNSSFARPTLVQLARLESALRMNPEVNLGTIVNDWKAKGMA